MCHLSYSIGACCAALQKPDKKLGYVRIPVEEVARNKSMKDEWPLLEADKGDIQLRCLSAAVQPSAPPPALLFAPQKWP